MRRHSIVARLGPTDNSRVKIHERGSVVTEIKFIDGQRRLGHGIGKMVDGLADCAVHPTDAALDLTLLAAAVTAADTQISRTSESQDSWTREIDLYVPVQNPDKWKGAAGLIQRTLNFLTGDRWRVFFRARHQDYQQLIAPNAKLHPPTFDSVCLFSGGLDSFVGAIDLLAGDANPLFVSHYWDTSTSSQTVCAQHLGDVYGDLGPRHVRAHIGFRGRLVANSKPEKTTRGRSFLFFAMATLAASGLQRETIIYVPENGLISLNVPLDPLRIGAWSTRTTHPFYMARWSDLTRHLGLEVTWQNPYRFCTKGEMLENCKNMELLQRHVAETISCSSVAKARWKRQPPGHCGYCVPCLIRRAAIMHAFGNDSTPYTLDSLTARTLNAKSAKGKNIRSFQMMARRLARRSDLARILVHKPGPLSDYSDGDITNYAAVFTRGMEEVDKIVNGVVVRPA